jgi:hypothetical protein
MRGHVKGDDVAVPLVGASLAARAKALGVRGAPAEPVRDERSLLRLVPPGVVLVGLVVVALAVWRVAFVLAGPDPDTDAYGHHSIARQILVDPKNLHVHWVWLPLFHYLQAGAIFLGATLDAVRIVNVLVSAAVPIVLYVTLRGHRSAQPELRADPTPAIAAIVCALSPISMQMGTTGQTEPLFALLTMGAAWALSRSRMRALSAMLVVAVLIRYESWAIVVMVAGLAVLERVLDRFPSRIPTWLRFLKRPDGSTPIAWYAWLAPVAAIFAWAAIRRPVDGAWFWFLKGTREFANGALGAKSSLDVGGKQLGIDLVRYAVQIPWRVLGYPLLLAPLGLVRAVRREGMRFCAVFVAVLGFVTLAWVMRSSLGLDRHFVALVPLYATLIAHGIVVLADGIAWLAGKVTARSEHAFLVAGSARAAIVAGLCCAVFLGAYQNLSDWMTNFRHASEEGWTDRRLLAEWLHGLPERAVIFCDEPTIEVLSGLDRHRFERIGAVDPVRVKKRAEVDGEAYVVSWAAALAPMRKVGVVVYRPPGPWKEDEGLEVVRVAR